MEQDSHFYSSLKMKILRYLHRLIHCHLQYLLMSKELKLSLKFLVKKLFLKWPNNLLQYVNDDRCYLGDQPGRGGGEYYRSLLMIYCVLY